MSVYRGAVRAYQAVVEAGHPVVKGWPMVDSPLPTLTVSVLYFLLTWKAKNIMKNRQPRQLRSVMVVYNLLMVTFNLYVLHELLAAGWLNGYSFTCQPLDSTPRAYRMGRACYLVYISKLVELLDTLFFVLRCKFELLTFLHVFHHGVMPINIWIGLKFSPGGSATFGPMLNVFVHTVMYVYYLLASLGPAYRKYLWWKRYMTVLQLTQFLVVMLQAGLVLASQCDYPKWIMVTQVLTSIFFFFLFLQFYAKAYGTRGRGTQEISDKAKNT